MNLQKFYQADKHAFQYEKWSIWSMKIIESNLLFYFRLRHHLLRLDLVLNHFLLRSDKKKLTPNHYHWLFLLRRQPIAILKLNLKTKQVRMNELRHTNDWLSSIQKSKDVLFVWMIIPCQNNLINVVIYFVRIVLMLIFKMLNLNVHVVLLFMVKFEV